MKSNRVKRPVLLTEPDSSDLLVIVTALNKGDEVGKELRALVDRWMKSGPDLKKMVHADRELWQELQAAWTAKWLPTNGPRAHYASFPNIGHASDTPARKARLLFSALVLNPKCEMLGGPCSRPLCNRYFVKKRSNQKAYCGRRCGHIVSATASNRDRLARERAAKVKRATALIQDWDALKTRPAMDWKRWVYQADNTISSKWLTRAVNPDPDIGYGLRPPKKRSRNA